MLYLALFHYHFIQCEIPLVPNISYTALFNTNERCVGIYITQTMTIIPLVIFIYAILNKSKKYIFEERVVHLSFFLEQCLKTTIDNLTTENILSKGVLLYKIAIIALNSKKKT